MTGVSMESLRIGLVFGWRSVEHDVSLVSAASRLGALDRTRYEGSLSGIVPGGGWHLLDAETSDLEPTEATRATLRAAPVEMPGSPAETTLRPSKGEGAGTWSALQDAARLDVVFPIVHGRGGEDGLLQGLLESAGVPYVGSGVASSAIQMDKDFAKRLLSQAGLPVTPWITFSAAELEHDGVPAVAERAEVEIGLPAYVKPANSGSSIGIDRADSMARLISAIDDARRYDRKVLVEAAVDAREVEVAVLGNDSPEASVVGEIRATQSFYDYDAKYRDDATELIIPADLDPDLADTVRATAVEAYRALGAEGMARVDFLIERETHRIYVNELNSLPGFTSVSMYPKLWEATGLPYPRLLDRLIELALERHDHRAKLETHAPPPLSRDDDS